MIQSQNMTIKQAVLPVSLNNATATAVEIDVRGFNHVTYVLHVGATTGAIDSFKVQGAPTTGGTLADISGATLATLPGASDDGKLYAIHIDLTDKSINQFHQVDLSEDNTGTGIYGVTAILSRNQNPADSATDRGYAAEAFA